jgi:glycosyltransferase involved in cell wall biosynthesis
MKVLYARTQFWFGLKAGGSVAHTIGVLNGLKENGCNAEVFSNEDFAGMDGFRGAVVRPVLFRERYSWLGELLYNFYAKERFREYVRRFRPDFIYHRFNTYTDFVAEVAECERIPLILEFNSSVTLMDQYRIKKRSLMSALRQFFLAGIEKKIEVFNLKKSSLVIVVSDILKSHLLEMSVPEKKIFVSPNGADPLKFNPSVSLSERIMVLKKEFGINPDNVVIGFAGTFAAFHGIPYMIGAIKKILSGNMFPGIRFLLIGKDLAGLDDDMREELSGLKGVAFTGLVPYADVQNYLGMCDILVSPHCPLPGGKMFFGSPTKLFEYMAMGKGIVASNLGQIGDVLENGKTAVLVEPGNTDELVSGILKLAGDKKLREEMGAAARRELLSNYTWKANTGKILDRLKNER